jgi:hypothetical protein
MLTVLRFAPVLRAQHCRRLAAAAKAPAAAAAAKGAAAAAPAAAAKGAAAAKPSPTKAKAAIGAALFAHHRSPLLVAPIFLRFSRFPIACALFDLRIVFSWSSRQARNQRHGVSRHFQDSTRT